MESELTNRMIDAHTTEQQLNVARWFAQLSCSTTKEALRNCIEVIERLSKDLDPKSPLGMQVKLTLDKANGSV